MNKVIDILANTNEEMNVNIISNNEVVSCYDGRNSIDEEYNDCNVLSTSLTNNTLDIVIA